MRRSAVWPIIIVGVVCTIQLAIAEEANEHAGWRHSDIDKQIFDAPIPSKSIRIEPGKALMSQKTVNGKLLAKYPDTSPDSQLAWDAWRKRVRTKIMDQFRHLDPEAFHRLMASDALFSYQVTRDRHVRNIGIVQKSPDDQFNTLASQSIKSLEGDPILEFPIGSKLTEMTNFAVFALRDRKAND